MQAQVVAEIERDDGMVDMTIEMDEEFEAIARTAAEATGKTLEEWMHDAIVAAVKERIVEANSQRDATNGGTQDGTADNDQDIEGAPV